MIPSLSSKCLAALIFCLQWMGMLVHLFLALTGY
jgi:hypothetical protein